MAKRIYNQVSLFGPLYAYLVILSPPAHIKAAIARIKRELHAISNITERNLHSVAHITLTDKLTDDIDFPAAIEALVQNEKPFTIKLSGWKYFDHGHSVTIYINIVNPEPVINLMKRAGASSKSPHISLAKKVPHATFEKLKPYLEQLHFNEEWICNKVVILRKLMMEKYLGWKDSFTVKLNK